MIDLEQLSSIDSVEQLEDVLTTPDPQLIEAIKNYRSPLVILGAAGKMGPSLAVLAQRAAEIANHQLQIIAVSRFRNSDTRQQLERQGIETQAADLLDRQHVADLPDSENIIYLIGMKFGTTQSPAMTWGTNTVAPMLACERYPGSKIVALSTGNVYPMTPVSSQGSQETDSLTPLGEYANAAVARERVIQFMCERNDIQATLIRLNYAHDLRYGVISDIAGKIHRGQPIDLSMGYFNAIWQGDANSIILRSLERCQNPPLPINVTSPVVYRVRDIAQRLAKLMRCDVQFVGQEDETALLSDASEMVRLFGEPAVPVDKLVEWVAEWTTAGKPTLGKPTGFETRDGKF